LTVPDFFNILSGAMLILFILVLVIIFAYEYESLRKERS
jgi:hypothetical protein